MSNLGRSMDVALKKGIDFIPIDMLLVGQTRMILKILE